MSEIKHALIRLSNLFSILSLVAALLTTGGILGVYWVGLPMTTQMPHELVFTMLLSILFCMIACVGRMLANKPSVLFSRQTYWPNVE